VSWHSDNHTAGDRDGDNATPQMRLAFLKGADAMCTLLLTSPAFNPSQRQVIEDQAHRTRAKMEALGANAGELTR
jgi:hypothetical protein